MKDAGMDWLGKRNAARGCFIVYLFIFGCAGSSLLLSGFSLIAVSGGYSLVAACWPLIVVASAFAEHKL